MTLFNEFNPQYDDFLLILKVGSDILFILFQEIV